MCLYEYEGLSKPLYPYSLCTSTESARTDLPLTISVQVLPLFERFLFAKECRVRGLSLVHLLFSFCLKLHFFFHVIAFYSMFFQQTSTVTINSNTVLWKAIDAFFWVWLFYITVMHKRPVQDKTRDLVTSFIPHVFFPHRFFKKKKQVLCLCLTLFCGWDEMWD